jgi:hypothetical protein
MGALTPRPPQSPEPSRPGAGGGLSRFAGAPDMSDQYSTAGDLYAVGADKVATPLRSALSAVTPGDLLVATTGDPVVRRRQNGSLYQATVAMSVTRTALFYGELRRALTGTGKQVKPAGPWRANGDVVDLVGSELRSATLASRPLSLGAAPTTTPPTAEGWRQTLATTLALLPDDVDRRIRAFVGDDIVWAHEEMLRTSQPVRRSSLRHGTYTATALTERVALVVASTDRLVAVSAERSAEGNRSAASDDALLAGAQWDVRLLSATRGERRTVSAEPPAVGGSRSPQLPGSPRPTLGQG